IAVLAGGTIAAGRSELVARADASEMFVVGAVDQGTTLGTEQSQPLLSFVSAGGKRARPQEIADAEHGVQVLRTLTSYCVSGGVVVDRGHVLAVECGEGVAALIARGAALRQWGR